MCNYMSLKDKCILITGAAGRIGSAVAKLAFEAGAKVILTDINYKGMEDQVNHLKEIDNSRVCLLECNIALAEDIESMINQCLSINSIINGAVHCAYPRSKGCGTRFEDIKPEDLYLDLNMQLGGSILFSKNILKCFERQREGSLIHVSSIQGVCAPKFEHYEGTSMNSPLEYAAIKAGIISITRWLAKYYANKGVRVNCVSPGGIKDNQPVSFQEKYKKSCTNIGLLNSDQVAKTIIFLLSEASFAINGQNIIIDDGWVL